MRKTSFYTTTVSIISLFSFIMLTGCSKNHQDTEISATITSIFPTSAGYGEIITVYGKNLLKDSAGFSITINKITALSTNIPMTA
ncbi:MAG: IPT/TIG domain-containing protein [Ginsengibacter sp.]